MGMRRMSSLFLAGIVSACGLVACGERSAPPARHAGDDARDFVREHRAELEAEITVGSGPRLYDLAVIAGCQDVPALNRRLHKQRGNLFAPVGGSAGEAAGAASASGAVSAPSTSSAGVPPSDDDVAERVVRFMSENGATTRGTPDSGELRCLYLEIGRDSELAAGRRHIGPLRGPTTARGGTP
jgi:hypothetical protein